MSLWRVCLASVAAIFFIVVLISENVPASQTETSLDWIDRATLASGLEQGWGVFAPIPASLEVQTYAIATFSSGEEARWDPPSGNLIVGSARFERWRKWSTRVRTKDSAHNWETNALRIAEDIEADFGIAPEVVRLYRRWSEALPPGQGFDREYSEFMFFEYDTASGEGFAAKTTSTGGVVLELDEDLPPIDELPAIDERIPAGELPNPTDPVPRVEQPPQRDPAASTTSQLDPIDHQERRPGQGVVLGLDDELPPLDQIELSVEGGTE